MELLSSLEEKSKTETESSVPVFPLHQDCLSGSGGPFVEGLLSLFCAHCKLAETVERNVLGEKPFDDAGEEEHASAGEHLFVEFELHTRAPGEGDSVFRNQTREMTGAGNTGGAVDLLLRIRGA